MNAPKLRKLRIVEVVATVLFIWNFGRGQTEHWTGWVVPFLLMLLIIVNSVWFTRAVSWVIFAGAFFCLCVLLSAFTLRWRLEPGFSSLPFYRAMAMYAAFVYVSLAQIKILGGNK